ncbi:MAG: rhodanese-like domain-containing protein [Thermodesulfobacteriota bacterium]
MKKPITSVFILGISVLMLTTILASASTQEIPRIKPEELKKLIDSKDPKILVVDTQPKGAYDVGHVKGAVSFPWAPELKSPGKLPKNKTLVLYCDCAHEEDSIDTATQLKERWGYTNLKILEGGWSKWQELKYPIDKK